MNAHAEQPKKRQSSLSPNEQIAVLEPVAVKAAQKLLSGEVNKPEVTAMGAPWQGRRPPGDVMQPLESYRPFQSESSMLEELDASIQKRKSVVLEAEMHVNRN